MLVIFVIISLLLVVINTPPVGVMASSGGLPPAPYEPSSLDGIIKAFQPATIVTDNAFISGIDKDDAPHYHIAEGTRVYAHYEFDGEYFVELPARCMPESIYGWLSTNHVLLDRDVVSKNNK